MCISKVIALYMPRKQDSKCWKENKIEHTTGGRLCCLREYIIQHRALFIFSLVSHHYGYGLLDAGKLVDLAQKWEMTHPQRRCEVNIVNSPQLVLCFYIYIY